MSPHNSEAPPFPEHTPDGSNQQHSRRPTEDSSVRRDQSSPDQPVRFSSRDSLGNKPAAEVVGRRSSDNPKDEVDPAKIHATRTMWQQKLDEKLAKKEQEEYDAELKEVRRRQLENERETRKFLRRESETGSGGFSHYSLSPGSLDDLQNRARSFSNSSRDGGGVLPVSPSGSPHPLSPSPPPPVSSSPTPLDEITEEERARRQEEDDLLVAQRLQEEEALAASAAYPQPGESSPSHLEEGLGSLGGAEEGRRGGENDELDPDFLLAMQLQEQAHREAQQEADSLLAARLQNEEAARAGEGRVSASSSSSSHQQEAYHHPQGLYCGPGNQFYPYACPPSRPPPYSSTSVPAYRTTGGLQNVPQREGVQRIQTVASVPPPSPPSHSRPSAGEVKKKRRGLLSRLFGGKKDKPSPSDSSEKTAASSPPPSSSSFAHNDSPQGEAAAAASSAQRDDRRSTRPPRHHFLEEEEQNLPGFRPDLVAYCCNSFNNTDAPRVQPVVAQYTPVGQPQCIQQTLVVQPPGRDRAGEGGERQEEEEEKKEEGEGGVRKESSEGMKAERRGQGKEGGYRRLKEEEDEEKGVIGSGDKEGLPSSRRQVVQRIQTVEPGLGGRRGGEGGVYPSYPVDAQGGMAASSSRQRDSSLEQEKKRQEEKNKEDDKKK